MVNFYLKRYTLWSVFLFLVVFENRAQVVISAGRVCFGAASNIQNNSTIPAQQVAEWDLDNDGFFDDATGSNIDYTFSSADTFPIRLRITDTTGTEFFSSNYPVIVDPIPSVAFTFSGVCFGQVTAFTNQSTIADGTPLTYNWDFTDDGTNDNSSANPNFQYSPAGNYTIKLMANSNQGCSSFLTQNISVTQPPVANFSLPSTCVNSPALFVNQSSFPGAAIQRAIWNLGSESYSFNLDSVVYTYITGDTFFVQLKVIDSNGCADSITQSLIVESTVNYNVTLSNGYQFYQGQSTAAEVTGAFVSIVWQDSSLLPTKTISTQGYYSFTVTNSSGCVASDGFNITTTAPPTNIERANDFITQNADGKNDFLAFENIDAFTGCKLKVYDARGLHIFSHDNYNNDWDGGSNNAGAYYYFLKCNEVPEVKGVTNLIR
jgi:gliding motility-associated-like protein